MNNFEEMEREQPVLESGDAEVAKTYELEMTEEQAEGSLKDSKFKSVESLVKAYESLEKEFTKKCQQLSELTKQNALNDDNKAENDLPEFKQTVWKERVKDFFEKNSEALSSAEEISKMIASNKDVAHSNNSLALAWAKVLHKGQKTAEDWINNPEFLDNYVFNNSAIKEKIIKDYLKNITTNQTAPVVIEDVGTGITLTPKSKPRSLEEAGRIARELLKG